MFHDITTRYRHRVSRYSACRLAHLAARPTDVRSWGGVLDVLPELVAAVAQGAPNGGRDALEVADTILPMSPGDLPPIPGLE